MTIINGLGQKLVISDSEDLRSFKVHLGLLGMNFNTSKSKFLSVIQFKHVGIVVDITLYTVPLYKVLAHNYVVSDTILTDGVALNLAKTSDQIIFCWYPTFKEVVVINFTYVPVNTTGNAITAIVPPTYGYFNFVLSKAKEIAFDLTSSECALASSLGK